MADNLTTDDIIDVNDVGESEITGTEKIVALTAEGEVTTVSTESVITANKNELETEKTARASADTALEGKITTEVSRATTAENNLSTSISSVSTNLSSHTGNKSNPHGVTKSQVGLGNVPNVTTNDQTPTYTAASADTALTSGEKLSVAFGKIAKAISSLISHLGNKSNPHGVTKAQVGLGNVVNTGDSATPTNGGTTKFTTGGAYTLKQSIDKNTSAIATLNGTGTGSVTKAVSDGIAKVVANAPASFDTLKEISDWIDTHEDGASSMNSAIQANTNDITDIRSRVPVNSANDERKLICRELWLAYRPYQGNNEADFDRKLTSNGLHYYSKDGKVGCIGLQPITQGANTGTCACIDADQILLGAYENGGNKSKDLKTVVAKSYKVCTVNSTTGLEDTVTGANLTNYQKKVLKKIFGALLLSKCLNIRIVVYYKLGSTQKYCIGDIIGDVDPSTGFTGTEADGVTLKINDSGSVICSYCFLGTINENGDFVSHDIKYLLDKICKGDFSIISKIIVYATIMENWV